MAIAWQLSESFVTQPSVLDGNLLVRLAPDFLLLHFHQYFPCKEFDAVGIGNPIL